MGVKGLWSFLSPVQQHLSLEDLSGQVIAVDLSIWIVEANSQLPKSVVRPHLRNLFFRVLHLLQLGIVPVIVIEGIPPDLKQAVMQSRLHHANHQSKVQRPVKRTRFNAIHKECCEMLEYLGLPYVQAAGEAEAMCAYLSSQGLVDGCITNDGDAFLYGARRVYRNFTMNTKDPHVEAYDAKEVETELGLTRRDLVGLAILLGCDYLPKGVPGCGKDMAKKLLSTLKGESLLDRFDKWLSFDRNNLMTQKGSHQGMDALEFNVCRKALLTSGFPHAAVIDEFLVNRNKRPNITLKWNRPRVFMLMNYAWRKMEWPEEYTLLKLVPILTLFDMKNLVCSGIAVQNGLLPHRIVKSRIRQGVACYEVEWFKIEGDPVSTAEFYTTIENQELFSKAFPDMINKFKNDVIENKRKKKTKSKNGAPQKTTATEVNLTEISENFREFVLSEDDDTGASDRSRKQSAVDQEISTQFQETLESMDGYRSSCNRRRSKSCSSFRKDKKTKSKPRLVLSSDSEDDLVERIEDKNRPCSVSSQEHVLSVGAADQKLKHVRLGLESSEIITGSDDDSDNDEMEKYLPLSRRLELQVLNRINGMLLNDDDILNDQVEVKFGKWPKSEEKENKQQVDSTETESQHFESAILEDKNSPDFAEYTSSENIKLKELEDSTTDMFSSDDRVDNSKEIVCENNIQVDSQSSTGIVHRTISSVLSPWNSSQVGNFNIDTSIINFSCDRNKTRLSDVQNCVSSNIDSSPMDLSFGSLNLSSSPLNMTMDMNSFDSINPDNDIMTPNIFPDKVACQRRKISRRVEEENLSPIAIMPLAERLKLKL